MPSIEVDGGRLVYATAGSPDAPPLILVHGWTSYGRVWEQTIEKLQTTHYCICLDLMGFGDSDKPVAGNYSIEMQGQRVLMLADALNLAAFTLVGHSMGGQIAIMIAGKLAPQRVNRLVSVAGVVTGRLSAYVRYLIYPAARIARHFPLLFDLFRPLIHHPGYARFNFAPWFYRMEAVPFESWAEDRYRALQPGAHIATHSAAQAIAMTGVQDLLPHITAPSLVIHGVQDGTVPVSDAWLFHKQVPDCQMVLLEECGHFPMYEKFSDYVRALEVFTRAKKRTNV